MQFLEMSSFCVSHLMDSNVHCAASTVHDHVHCVCSHDKYKNISVLSEEMFLNC